MKCSILIPYVEEKEFIKGSIRQIKKFRHPEIENEIIIIDQSLDDEIKDLYSSDPEIKLIKCPRVDAGYPIDVGLRNCSGEYFCSLDADAFPIHKNWLYVPIKLIEKYNFSFIGKQTGLHLSYKNQGNFFHINNYFRVSRKDLALKVSEDVGFLRYENHYKVSFAPRINSGWNISCDNGVVAQWWSDKNKMGPKLSLAMNKFMGMTKEMGVYGMVIDDLIFHMVFGFGREWIQDLNKTLGDEYLNWNRRIIKEGLSDEIINELLSNLKPCWPIETDRELWDGEKPERIEPGNEIWEYIQELKQS
jgi:glycosyltransferase involved in cell wall biosynthesis